MDGRYADRAEAGRVLAEKLKPLAGRQDLVVLALPRGGRPAPALRGKTVVLVDDGLATGNTMRAAVEAVRAQRPARVIVAVPVAARASCEELAEVADEVVCGRTPEPFRAVGLWYDDFEQTSDEEVGALLSQAQDRDDAAQAAAAGEGVLVRIDAGGVQLEGDLAL